MSAALPIIRAAFQDIGALDPLESLPPEWASDALRRLNALVSAWKTQPLASVLSIDRAIFNLQAEKQTYFIGEGAELNYPRPQDITAASLLLSGLGSPQTISSLTRVDLVATATCAAHGFAVNDQVFVYTTTGDSAWNGTQVVTSVPTSNTFTFTVLGNPISPATGTITVQGFTSLSSQVEIPISMLTISAYESIRIKGLTNSQFTQLFYNPTYPYGTVFLWPVPTTADNQLILYVNSLFQGFANLTRDYAFADVAGYESALEYNLAVRLASPYGRTCPDDITRLARESLGTVKRQNYTIADLPSDSAAAVGGDRRRQYNINTGY